MKVVNLELLASYFDKMSVLLTVYIWLKWGLVLACLEHGDVFFKVIHSMHFA
jgi:hypothetical protein